MIVDAARPRADCRSSSRCIRSCGASTARTSRRASTCGRLPTEGEQVLVGPGENAGVVDVGDGIAVALRIESHNHPSAIEPYQGAATGVGGILRDIFTMGARPIALDGSALHGPARGRAEPVHPRRRRPRDRRLRQLRRRADRRRPDHLRPGIRRQSARQCLLPRRAADRAARARGSARDGVGQPRGAARIATRAGRDRRSERARVGRLLPPPMATGRRVLATTSDASKRPSVQVGDPFEEKRLIEACLELLDAGARRRHPGSRRRRAYLCDERDCRPRRPRDGRSTSTPFPLREPDMTPVEIMTSESQERMLAIVDAGERSTRARRVRAPRGAGDRRRDGTCAEPDGTGMLVVRDGPAAEPVLAEVPARSLADEAPLYDRPLLRRRLTAPSPTPDVTRRRRGSTASPTCWRSLDDPSWIYRQYDHQLFLNTVSARARPTRPCCKLAAPGVPLDGKALALTSDANPGWCAHRPAGRDGRSRSPSRRSTSPAPGPAARRRQLPQLRQPGAPRGDVAAVRGDRRHGRGVPRASASRSSAATSRSTTRPPAATSTRRRSSASSG